MDYPLPHSSTESENETGLGLAVEMAAPAAAPQPNEAGTAALESEQAVADTSSPRLVIRGESSSYREIIAESGERYAVVLAHGHPKLIELPQPLANGVAAAALIDYLNCSFPFRGQPTLAEFFGSLFRVVGRSFGPAVDRGRGFHGYKQSFSLGDSSAIFAYGGNRETALISFPGDACHQIPDWIALVRLLRDDLAGRITRLDCAVDDFEGRHSVDEAVQLYRADCFNAGGRKPTIKQSGNWLDPDGSGRTFYVGSRKSGKLLRVYEKGMQLGIPWHSWVRWEVEWHNKDREVPWAAVFEPGKYVAGAYPKALAWVSEEQSRIRTLSHTAKIGYDALTHWNSVAFGKHIDVMMNVEGSAEAVIEKLRRPGVPRRLQLPDVQVPLSDMISGCAVSGRLA